MMRRPENGRNNRPLGRDVTYDLTQGKVVTAGGSRCGGRATGLIPRNISIHHLASEISNGEIEVLRLHGFDHAQGRTVRDMEILCQALEGNNSLVEVNMGWSIQEKSVGLLLEKVASLPNLKRLSLKTFTWISESSMLGILGNKSLRELECQGVWVRTAAGGRETVVESVLGAANVHITKLRLIRCSLRNDDCEKLCRFSHLCSDLRELCVQGNRLITGSGIASLVQAKVTRLDMTECAIFNEDLAAIVQVGQEGNFGPEELVLSRNDRISTPDSPCFLRFAKFCINRLKLLDLSECRIQDNELLSILALLRSDSCRLQSFFCEGCFSIPVHEIAQTLIKNQTLFSIVLATCRDEYDLHLDQRTFLADSLRRNYNLYSLEINCCGRNIILYEDDEESDPTRAEIDFLLRLNRAGRKVLLEDGCTGNPAVLREVLKKTATQGDDVLFWFLQNGLSTQFAKDIAV
jgi:hypothetical protein